MTTFSRRDVMQLFGAGALALAGPMARTPGDGPGPLEGAEHPVLGGLQLRAGARPVPHRARRHGPRRVADQRPDDDQPAARRRDQRLGPDQRQQSLGAQDHAARGADQAARPRAEFEPYFETMLPAFKPPYRWAMSRGRQRADRHGAALRALLLRRQHRQDQPRGRRGPGLGPVERPGQRRQVRHPRVRRLERLQHLHDRRHRPVQRAHARGDGEVRRDRQAGVRRARS